VQAQDYLGALWAVGLRLRGAVGEADVERALAGGAIVRTHAMRWTWQLVAPADLRWLIALVGPRVIAGAAGRHRQLGLDVAAFRASERALAGALAGGARLTRAELGAALARGGVAPDGQRLPHLLGMAELAGLICGAGRRGKQPTWGLVDDLIPAGPPPGPRDELIAELARRYLRGRAPATADDFAWWSGLPITEARRGLAATGARADREGRFRPPGAPPARAASGAWLLPFFDEYLVGYRDRSAMLDSRHRRLVNDRGGMLNPCVVVDGRVVGTWRRTLSPGAVAVELALFAPLPAGAAAAVEAAARRYAGFLGRSLRLISRRARRSAAAARR
jgi:hypothetical protein